MDGIGGWGPGSGANPIPPQNVAVVSPFTPNTYDLRWDNPALLARNADFHIVGVNIYRSDVTDRGPYYRINEFPVGGTFYRDAALNAPLRETVNWDTAWVFKGNAPNDRRWVFRTLHPIVKRVSQMEHYEPTAANAPTDVHVYIDGQEVIVDSVFGPTGEVTLINLSTFNVGTEKNEPAVIPTASSLVEIEYFTPRNKLRSGLEMQTFYRMTTVALDPCTPDGYRETDLSWSEPVNTFTVERLDYIWREAIRRNAWILQQGGERVNIFIRRTAGIPCSCTIDPQLREYSQQPSNRCLVCYGTGYVGGYEGPYTEIIAPDDAERKISQGPWGRRQEHTYEVFMGPSPVVTMRDFIVKQTDERYSIGAVRRPTNRGNLLQQHFNIQSFDSQDIRSKVPIYGTTQYPWPQTRYGFRQAPSMPVDGELSQPPSIMPDKPAYPVGPSKQIPMQTEKANTPEEKEQRGRTPVWENIEYGFLIISLPLVWEVVNAVSRAL